MFLFRGDSTGLTNSNLSVDTNLNMFGSDITYLVTEGPHSGSIRVEDRIVTAFTAQGRVY